MNSFAEQEEFSDYIKARLHALSHYLVFEEDWFNAFVFQILKNSGFLSIAPESPQMKDLTVLMTLKFSFGDFKPIGIPRCIHLGIISIVLKWFSERMSVFPLTVPVKWYFSWVSCFGTGILPESLAYFIGIMRLPIDEQNKMFNYVSFHFEAYSRSTVKLLEFLVTKPDFETHKQLIILWDLNSWPTMEFKRFYCSKVITRSCFLTVV